MLLKDQTTAEHIDHLDRPARSWEPAPTVPNHDVSARIGTGSTSTVWKARHRLVDQNVAVKILAEGFRDRAEERRRSFLTQARIARIMPHPNLVRVFDVGTTRTGLPFLTMELGVRTLRNSERLSTKLLALQHVALALGHLHRNGILHCDVKPANVLLIDDTPTNGWTAARFRSSTTVQTQCWTLADLGMALRASDPPTIGAGTFGFIAPERFRKTVLSPASDIYSYARLVQHVLRQIGSDADAEKLEVVLAPSLSADPTDREVHASDLFDKVTAAIHSSNP